MKLRLTSRIVLLFVLMATLLLAAVGLLSHRSGSESLKAAAISEMLAAAIEKEAALDTWIEERSADIRQLSTFVDLDGKAANLIAAPPGSEEAHSAHAILLEELRPRTTSPRSGFIEMFVMEPESGKVMASTSPAEEGKTKLGHPYFDGGKTKFYLQGPYKSIDLKAPAMTAAIPLRATDGRVVAVLAARLDLAVLNTIAQRRTGLRQTEDSFLFNAGQFPVTQPRFINKPAVLSRKLDTEAIRGCAARNSGVALAPDYRGVPSIAVYRWNAKRQLGLIVKIDQAEALAPARAFGWSVVLISGLALLVAVGLAFLLARTITRPLRALHDGVRRFAEGNLQQPLLESPGDEVGLLAGEFNAMAARVGERTAEIARANKALKAENAERIRTAETLQLSEERLRELAENINDVFWVTDPKTTKVLYVSPVYEKLWGRTCQSIYEQPTSFLEGVHPDDRKGMLEALDRLAALGTYQYEYRVVRPDGSIRWVLDRGFPIRNKQGEVVRGAGVVQDITERKQSEEALHRSEQRYRALVETARDIIFAMSSQGIVTSLNPEFFAATGWTLDECVGQSYERLIQAEDLARAQDLFGRALHSEVLPVFELRLNRRDGSPMPTEFTITTRAENGQVVELLGIGRDLTERKQATEALRASQQFIEGILNAMPVRVFWKDKNLVYLGCNAVFARDVGFADPKDIIGKDDYQIGSGDQAELYRGDDRQVIETGCSKLLIEEPQTTPEGKTITLLTSKLPLRNAKGEVSGVLGTYMDITERKQSEEVLRQRVELQDQLVHTAATVPGMIFSLLMRPDGSSRMPYASGALSEIFDVQPKDVIDDAAPVFSLIHPDDIGHVMATIAESARTLNPWRDDFRVCRTRLGEIWVEGHSVPQREPDGSTLWHGFVQNITERKRTELRLAAFANLGQRLNAANTAREAARIISEVADELLGWDACLFSLLSPSSGLLDHVMNVDTIDGRRVESSPGPEPPSALARRAIETGGQLILKERPDRMFPGSQPFGDSARPSASIMYVPARKGAEVVGVMSIQSYTPGAYDAGSLETLQALADHCGGALDRLRAQEDLRRSETKFRTLYDSTSDAVMLSDMKGFFDCNQAALAMFGCGTREEFCSKHPADVSPPMQPDGTDSLTLASQYIATAMEKGSHRFEWLHKRAGTGETFPAEVLLSAIELDGKRALQAVVRDITERKRSEESLRLQSAALEAAANAIVITDQNGTIQFANPAFTALTGYTAQEAVGQNPRILKSGKQDEAFYRKLWQTISSGQVWSGEVTNRRKDGSLYTEEMTITPLRNADGVIVRYIAIKQDITKRKAAEELLRLSEERLRIAAETTNDAIYEWDLKQSVEWLGKIDELLGYEPGEFPWTMDAFVASVHPEDSERTMAAIQAHLEGRGPFAIEYRVRRKDGVYRWWSARGAVARRPDGTPTRWIGSVTDITGRKQAEEKLQWKTAFLEAQVNSSPDGIMVVDQDGKQSLQNQRFVDLFKMPEHLADEKTDELRVRWTADTTKNPEQFIKRILHLLAHPNEMGRDEIELKDGTIVDRYSAPVIGQDGKYYGRIWTFRDITERKRTETALRESDARYHGLFAGSADGILVADIETKTFKYANPALSRMLGYSEDELRAMGVLDIHPKDAVQSVVAEFEAQIRGDKTLATNIPCLRKDGSVVHADINATEITIDNRPCSVGFFRDITERRRAQAELENLQRQLVDASREAGMAEIATSVLHNVGNVLNSINVSTGLVAESVKKSRASSLARVVVLLQEHAHDLGAFITQDSRGKHVPAHLAQLAEHLQAEQETNVRELELLRHNVDHVKEIVAMQQTYASFGGVKEMINVVHLVEDSLRINEGALSRHEVEVVREFESVPTLNVEKHKILQILVNLLRNAKYACHDSERADKRLTVRVANGEGRIRISVIDNGVGIPPENLTRIFNHGFTTRKDGHGFGLHSSALAAKEMGGSLTVRSDGVGQGAAFTLELPCPARENSDE